MLGAADRPDRVIGERYALEKLIGTGGMGEVWRARHLALKSTVAIKLLHGASAQDDESRKRFLTEAQVTANLKTRHAVQVFDFGVTEDGIPFLAMELLEGETLGNRIGRLGRLSPLATVRLMRQAARALDRAHALGIVHRDFKPDNIIILEDEEGQDEVKVVDFGIAKLMGELEAPPTASFALAHDRNPLATFTRTGNMVGTPCYMSPEQIDDPNNVGGATDVWALGVVAYEALTGVRPFDAETIGDLLQRIIEGRFTPIQEAAPDLPEAFDQWFRKACARRPPERFPDAQSAVTALALALDVPLAAGRATLPDVPSDPGFDDPSRAVPTPSNHGRNRIRKGAREGEPTLDARSFGVLDLPAPAPSNGGSASTPSATGGAGRGLARHRLLVGAVGCAVAIALVWIVARGSRASNAQPESAAPEATSATAMAPTSAASGVDDARGAPGSADRRAPSEAERAADSSASTAARRSAERVDPHHPSRPTAASAAHSAAPAEPTAAPAPLPPPSKSATSPSPYRLPDLGL